MGHNSAAYKSNSLGEKDLFLKINHVIMLVEYALILLITLHTLLTVASVFVFKAVFTGN